MTTELLQKIDEACKIAASVQEKFNKIDSESQFNAKKAADDFCKVQESIQNQTQSIKALEETSKFLEKTIARMPNSATAAKESGVSEIDIKARDEFMRYVRKGALITPEIIEQTCEELARKSFSHLTKAEIEQQIMQFKNLSAGTDPQGGYWVIPQMSAQIIKRIFETSPMRQIAGIETIGSDELHIIIDDNELTTGGWVGEKSDRSETSTPDIGLVKIPVHEIYAQPMITQKLLDDSSFNAESWLSEKVADKITRETNTAYVSGDGSKKPKGFLSYSGWTTPTTAAGVTGVYERGKLEQINSGTLGGFDGDSLILLDSALLQEFQANAVWLMKRMTFTKVLTAKDGVGRYLMNPNLLYEGKDLVLMGKRVLFANDMPAIANDALAIALGDFKEGYKIVDRLGIRVIRDFYTQKPFTKFYTTFRTGGAVSSYQSIKLLKLSA